MNKPPESLKHLDVDTKEDAVLVREAHQHLARTPSLQFVSELLAELRARKLPWWTPEYLRGQYGAQARMRWLAERADVRQQITTRLTGLLPRAARKKDADFQAGLLDSAIEDGDATIPEFENAFEVQDLAVYGPVADLWRKFRARMPWGEDTGVHHELIGGVVKSLLAADGAEGLTRQPILTAWDVRTSIPGRVWHTRMPLDIRVAIDDARFAQERNEPDRPFLAKDDLAIALPSIMAKSIPLREFTKILDSAERAMGFETAAPEVGRGLSITPPSLAGGASASLSAPAVTSGVGASVANAAAASVAPRAPVYDIKAGELPPELLDTSNRHVGDVEAWALESAADGAGAPVPEANSPGGSDIEEEATVDMEADFSTIEEQH